MKSRQEKVLTYLKEAQEVVYACHPEEGKGMYEVKGGEIVEVAKMLQAEDACFNLIDELGELRALLQSGRIDITVNVRM